MRRSVTAEIHHTDTGDGSRRAGAMTGMLLVSRLLGVLRDALLTTLLGATPAADALRAALKIPATIRDLLSEGAISAAFIPGHQDQKNHGGIKAANRYSRSVVTLLLLLCSVLVGVLWWWAAEVIDLIAPGLDEPLLGSSLLTELLPYLLVVPFLAVLRGILLGADRTRSAVSSQVLQNVVLVVAGAAMVSLPLSLAECASGWTRAFLVGSVAGLLLMGWVARTAEPLPIPTWRIWGPGIGRLICDLSLLILTTGLIYINSIIAMRFASELGSGSITHLENAFRFHFLPIGLIGVALGTVAGVDAARLASRSWWRALARRIGRNQRTALFIALPAAIGLAILSEPLIRLVLQHGEFSSDDTQKTVATLRIYCLAIPFSCLLPALMRTALALKKRGLIILAAVVGVSVNLTCILLLADRYGVSGVAGASVISTVASWLWLEVGLRRYLAIPKPRASAVIANFAVTGAVAGWALLVTMMVGLLGSETWLFDLLTVFASALVGLWIALVVGRTIRSREVQSLENLLSSAFRWKHRS